MKSLKILYVFIAILYLSGCSGLTSVFSGNSSETVAMDASGNPIVSRFGTVKKLRTKQTQAAALGNNMQASMVAIAAVEVERLKLALAELKNSAPVETCKTMTIMQVNDLKADAQAVYLRSVESCQQRQFFASIIRQQNKTIAQLTQGKSDLAYVADSFGSTIRSVAHEGTAKVQAITRFATGGIIAIESRKAIQSGQESIRDIGITAANAKGNTTVGDITLSSSQHSTASGSGGSATGSGEGSVAGGSGTATSANDRSDLSPTYITIAGDANNSLATDTAAAQAGGDHTQNLAPSANGQVVDDSKQQGVNTADDLQGDSVVNDDDGGQTLF